MLAWLRFLTINEFHKPSFVETNLTDETFAVENEPNDSDLIQFEDQEMVGKIYSRYSYFLKVKKQYYVIAGPDLSDPSTAPIQLAVINHSPDPVS